MIIEQLQWTIEENWKVISTTNKKALFNLLLVFGNRAMIEQPEILSYLKENYPHADIVFSSTAGEIINDKVFDKTICCTAVSLENSKTLAGRVNIDEFENSYTAGEALFNMLQADDLKGIFVISDGHTVNGSDLVAGLTCNGLNNTIITGGLAGDGTDFKRTSTGLNELPGEGNIIGIGFYGNGIQFGHGSMGGWDPFGPERLITSAKENVLFTLDNKYALDIYKEYLGDLAHKLPGSALLFPLSIRLKDETDSLVRTVLSINENQHSMTFAGNIPQGAYARFMKANFDRLIDAASTAAIAGMEKFNTRSPELAILISCVGRRIVLNQRVEEELESVREIFGSNTALTGFYSYGELSPNLSSNNCKLHNQTMTITTLREEIAS